MITKSKSGRLLDRGKFYLLVLSLPFIFGAHADKWTRLAEHDLIFAKHLAQAGIQFGPKFLDGTIRERVSGCRPRPSKIAQLDKSQVQQIQVFSEHYCEPWYAVWSTVLAPCDRDRNIPKWCRAGNEELAAGHLKSGPYFETLTAKLGITDSALERYNIMAVVVDRLGHKVLRDYPDADKNRWATNAAVIFLERAGPEEAMAIGWSLLQSSLEDSPRLAEKYSSYATYAPETTEHQREILQDISQGLAGEILPPEVASMLVVRFGVPPAPPPAPPLPDRTDSADIVLLVARVDAYHRLLRDEEYIESWGMLSIDRRERSIRESYIRTQKYLRRHGGMRGWRIDRIQIRGDIAKVFLETSYGEKIRRLPEKDETAQEDATFWVFENNSWYRMLPGPPFWEKGSPREVTIPSGVEHESLGDSSPAARP